MSEREREAFAAAIEAVKALGGLHNGYAPNVLAAACRAYAAVLVGRGREPSYLTWEALFKAEPERAGAIFDAVQMVVRFKEVQNDSDAAFDLLAQSIVPSAVLVGTTREPGDMYQAGWLAGRAAPYPETVERVARETLESLLPPHRRIYTDGLGRTVEGANVISQVVARLSGAG